MAEAKEAKISRIPLFGLAGEESLDSPIDRRSEAYRHQARLHPAVAPQPQPLLTVPNLLTFFRLVLVPIIVVLWYSSVPHAAMACAVLFVMASITDWLDGFLARKLGVTTVFGAFLDPVADKIMVCSSLILLTTNPPAPLSQEQVAAPVIIIICREITMSALREWAASAGGSAQKAVKVNSLGKWKTALQMTAMSVLLFCRDRQYVQHLTSADVDLAIDRTVLAAWVLLWGSAVLALWSLVTYMSNVWTHFLYPPQPQPRSKLT